LCSGSLDVQNYKLAVARDEPPAPQIDVAYELVEQLKEFFCIEMLGGYREFARPHGTSRPSPGTHGLTLANMLRRDMGFSAP
jgi:hypothetical protein